MCNYIEQSSDIVPAWLTEAPPLLLCTSCGGMGPRGCTDCEERIKMSPISDTKMLHASAVLSSMHQNSSMPVLILQNLLRDIETKYDENGNEYPGVYPYWSSISGYCIAKDFIRSLEESQEECSDLL